ncbi:MAG: hypothetical protein IPJ65_00275 [Archangiaceae bacterium]|nr:hypothetical protein [Archangiaceae bacterium]
MTRLAASLVLAGCCSACSFATRPTLLRFEREGAAAPSGWTRVETSSFTLVTDFSPGTAQEAAQDIAAELAAVEAAFGNTAPRFENKVEVVLYQNGIDFEDRFGREMVAASRLLPETNEHAIYLWGRPTRWVHHNMVGQAVSTGSQLRQMLAHIVLARQISSTVLPKWLMYGLGGYVETLAWSDDGKNIELGALNVSSLEKYRRDRSLGFSDVTAPQVEHPLQQEAYLRAFEGYCWALVYTAVNTHPAGLGRYLAALTNTEPADPSLMFDGATPEAIDKEVEQFMLRGSFALRTVAVDTHELTAKVGPLPPNELARLNPAPR